MILIIAGSYLIADTCGLERNQNVFVQFLRNKGVPFGVSLTAVAAVCRGRPTSGELRAQREGGVTCLALSVTTGLMQLCTLVILESFQVGAGAICLIACLPAVVTSAAGDIVVERDVPVPLSANPGPSHLFSSISSQRPAGYIVRAESATGLAEFE